MAISGHQNYWLWGFAAERQNPYARPDRNTPIYRCRGLKSHLTRDWFRVRHWD